MFTEVFLPPLVGLLPVICFLAVLLFLDSYKLVRLPVVVAVVCCGVVVAGASYLIGAFALSHAGIGLIAYSRYVAPFAEELLKGLVIVALVRAHRIGFLVDAAIFGFAVGTGFALLENVYFLRVAADAGTGTWVVRGFGTALMHGGTTAIFAVLGLAILERAPRATWRAWLPGLLLVALLHSAFNHLNHAPKTATLAVLLVLPPLLYAVFERSERTLGDWLGRGFDADAAMLALIHSGRLSESPLGQYLHALKRRFKGPVVADVLCYLRLYTELALRAKGLLMLRANGFEVTVDEESKAGFEELRHLESSIGRTGLRALRPLLHMSHKELWQLYMLEAG